MGENLVVLKKIKTILGDKLEAICCNRDYTPYAVKRDTEIEKWCETQDIKFESVEDYLLGPIGSIKKSDGKPYTVFTPFKNAGFKMEVAKPNKKKIILILHHSNLIMNYLSGNKNKNFFSKK